MQDPVSDRHLARGPVATAPSLLRLSVAQRLMIAAGLAAILWGAVAWVVVGFAP